MNPDFKPSFEPTQPTEVTQKVEARSSPQAEIALEIGHVLSVRKLVNDGNEIEYVEIEGNSGAIFKPQNGEKTQRDEIPAGTYYLRERAAFIVDQFLQMGLVPTTVIREINGKIGALQAYVSEARSYLQLNMLEEDNYITALMHLRVLDYVIHNSDRHGGNVLVGEGRIAAIDNSLSFGGGKTAYLGNLADTPLAPKLVDRLQEIMSSDELQESLELELEQLLTPVEIEACLDRLRKIAAHITSHSRAPYDPEFYQT